jgi:hypothetical protein
LPLFSSGTVLTLPQGLLIFASEIVALAVLAAVIARVSASSRRRSLQRRPVLVAVLAVALVAVAVRDIRNTGLVVRDANRRGVAQRPGIDQCFAEAAPPSRAPFVEWLRARMPTHALYELELGGGPDPWCVTLALLPRLPIWQHDRPQYLVAFGTVPPAIQARIAAHDPTVQVFAPGYALARVNP